jgi:hypothetical protein
VHSAPTSRPAHYQQVESPPADPCTQPWTWDEPLDALPRPLVDRLLQRFAAQARTLADLEARMAEQAAVLERQAAELAQLRTTCGFVVQYVSRLRAHDMRSEQAPSARPWWAFWRH